MQISPENPLLDRYAPLIVFVVAFVLLYPGICSESGVTSKDEYWLAFRTPLETLARGDWVTPWVNGEPRLRKPPLLYWAILLGYKLFGINLFAARIWGVLAGAGLSLCSCLFAREIFSRSGLLAGLLTLATVGLAIEARQAMLDLPLAFFSSLGVYFAIRWWKSGRLVHILAAAGSLGLSFLVKGPIGIYFFAVGAVAGLIVFGGWRSLRARAAHIAGAVVLLLAVCLPWPILMALRWPSFFHVLSEEAGQRHFGRVDLFSPFSALGGALGLVFPWTLALAAAIVEALGKAARNADRRSLWLVSWYAAGVLPLFFMESFERYMLPVLSPMCLLCAHWLEDSTGSRTAVLRISGLLTALPAILICAFTLWFQVGILPTLTCLFLAALLLWITLSSPHPRSMALVVALLLAALFGGLYPALGIGSLQPGIEQIVGERPAAVYGGSQPAMLSMRLKRSVIPLSATAQTGPHSLQDFDGFVFMESFDAPRFEAAARQSSVAFSAAGSFKTFYSRKVWIRFARQNASGADWLKALKARSLEDLKTEICFYRVCPRGPCP